MLIILCAELEEAKHIKCNDALIVVTGAGVTNALNANKLNIQHNDTIINIGYVGSNVYPVGSVLNINKTKRLYPSITLKEKPNKICALNNNNFIQCACLTADNFIEGEFDYDLTAVDMELYYYSLIFPQIKSIKIVSDNLSYSEYNKADIKESWSKINKYLNEVVCKK